MFLVHWSVYVLSDKNTDAKITHLPLLLSISGFMLTFYQYDLFLAQFLMFSPTNCCLKLMLILLDELRVSRHVKPQRVGVNGVLTERRSCSTGSPQGSVLSPLLHILHTAVMTAHSVFSVVLSVRRLHTSEVFKGQLVLLVHS